jgi:hypothetical protein
LEVPKNNLGVGCLVEGKALDNGLYRNKGPYKVEPSIDPNMLKLIAELIQFKLQASNLVNVISKCFIPTVN